jgi:uncharacterized protein
MKLMVWKVVAILFVIQLALSLGHILLYIALRRFLGIGNVHSQSILKWALVVLSLFPLVASILVNNFIGSVLNGFYYFCATWLGIFHWLCLAGILGWLIYYSGKLSGFHLPDTHIGWTLFPLAILISAYGLYHSYQTRVVNYNIRLQNLSEFWQGKKVAFVVDAHLGNMRGSAFITKVSKLIRQQNPEIVLVPGDFFDGPPADYEALAKTFMDHMLPETKVYFTSGNHEEFRDRELYLSAIRSSGMKIINNGKDEVGGLQILGSDYFGNGNNEGLKKTLEDLNFDRNRPSILLKHAPTALEAASNAGVGLMISGHTHEGQVWPFRYITKILFKGYDYGHKFFGNTQIITSTGVGTWGPPQRVGTNSEIVIITLGKK